MEAKSYRVYIRLKDETSRTRHTSNLLALMKHLDNDLPNWQFCVVYDKKTNEKLGIYQNYPNNKTRPAHKNEL